MGSKPACACIIALLLLLGLTPAWAGDDPKPDSQAGGSERPVWIRFSIGADGMGVVNCNTCYTSSGCEVIQVKQGEFVACHAKPAPGYKFTHWTVNGNYHDNKPDTSFGTMGARLVGHFIP